MSEACYPHCGDRRLGSLIGQRIGQRRDPGDACR